MARVLQKLKWPALIIAALLLLTTVGATGYFASIWYGWFVPRMEPAELRQMLRQSERVHLPAGEGPFPTALLFSGCDGVRDGMERWAAFFVEQGWAAIIVDSLTPRGWTERSQWQPVCSGRKFWGTERAGDVLVALDDARQRPFVDPDRIVLAGWSHGAWAIMDLLALDPPSRLPFNLNRLPEGDSEDPLRGIAGVMLIYPYCGLGNRARGEGWSHTAPTFLLLAGADTVTAPETCQAIAEIQRDRGGIVVEHTYPGVDHGFDQQERAADSQLVFDPETTADAFRRAGAFLEDLTATPEISRR